MLGQLQVRVLAYTKVVAPPKRAHCNLLAAVQIRHRFTATTRIRQPISGPCMPTIMQTVI